MLALLWLNLDFKLVPLLNLLIRKSFYFYYKKCCNKILLMTFLYQRSQSVKEIMKLFYFGQLCENKFVIKRTKFYIQKKQLPSMVDLQYLASFVYCMVLVVEMSMRFWELKPISFR